LIILHAYIPYLAPHPVEIYPSKVGVDIFSRGTTISSHSRKLHSQPDPGGNSQDDAHHDAANDGYVDDDEDEEAGAVRGVILTVTVIGCDDLVPHKGTFVDAYVELTAGATKQKTKVQRKTTAPIFNEEFTFKGSDRKSLGLSIEVKHHNMISADVVLGKCEIANSKYLFGREAIETISMYKTAVGMDDAGSIDVKYRLDRVK
jgi:hypothetical protein